MAMKHDNNDEHRMIKLNLLSILIFLQNVYSKVGNCFERDSFPYLVVKSVA